MLSGDLHSFVGYFREFADAHPAIKYFTFGGIEKGISEARSAPGFDYPFLWLEEPIINTQDNGMSHVRDRFMVGISCLILAPLNDMDAQVDAYAQSLQILTDLQAKLRRDKKAGTIEIDFDGMKKLPVSQLWADSHYGFRLEFNLDLTINATIYG